MNAADLARLELAKRAYRAAVPREAEVQTGVRRARLGLARPKPRRAWFSKGLVVVVLAIGSLAYAKPQTAGELVERVLGRDPALNGRRLKAGVVAEPPVAAVIEAAAAKPLGHALPPSGDEHATRAAEARPEPLVPAAAAPAASQRGAASPVAPQPAAPQATGLLGTSTRASGSSPTPAELTAAEPASAAATGASGAMTDWGRVGQALAQGNSAEALSALGQLAESDDPSTRDKADLGRAQLLMAHGQPERACALARSLTHRRAGGRIERQAQLLLKSCSR